MSKSRLELFKEFMAARTMAELKEYSTEIRTGRRDRYGKDIVFLQLQETTFNKVSQGVCESLEEYYNLFLDEKPLKTKGEH